MIRDREIQFEQLGQRPEKALGLAKWKMENHADRQCGLDRDVGIGTLAAWFSAGCLAPDIERFIRNREYRLIKDEKGKVDLLLPDGEEGIVSLEFAPAPRQRVRSARFDLSKLEPTGVNARGVRLATKPVARLKLLARKRRPPPPPEPTGGGQASLF